MINFIVSELSDGYYLYLFVNHKYFEGCNNTDWVHDGLIYGIDMHDNIIDDIRKIEGRSKFYSENLRKN